MSGSFPRAPRSFGHLAGLLLVIALASAASERGVDPVPVDLAPVPVVGRACEGCTAVFDGAPATLASTLTLVGAHEPGERLLLSGRVLDRRGAPVAGVVLYVYQTDHAGKYPPAPGLGGVARRHGRLRGWVHSAADGGWRIETVRPGGYPGTDIPQHIHMHVIEPGCATYFVDDVMFRDDPRLTPAAERQLAHGAGGDGAVQPSRRGDAWQARRDVVLGLGIPGYPACGRG